MSEKLVASLELSQEYARLMKEKGREMPESFFVWSRQEDGVTWKVEYRKYFAVDMRRDVVALTSGEIGEMLQERVSSYRWEKWTCTMTSPSEMVTFTAPTEADARLKMLNYLLANDLVWRRKSHARLKRIEVRAISGR